MGNDFNDDDFELESVLRRARKVKGKELTPKEIAKFEKLCAEIAGAEKQVEELQAKAEDAEFERLKEEAEAIVQSEAQKVQSKPLTEEGKRALLAERAEILKKLRDLGVKVNEESIEDMDLPE